MGAEQVLAVLDQVAIAILTLLQFRGALALGDVDGGADETTARRLCLICSPVKWEVRNLAVGPAQSSLALPPAPRHLEDLLELGGDARPVVRERRHAPQAGELLGAEAGEPRTRDERC